MKDYYDLLSMARLGRSFSGVHSYWKGSTHEGKGGPGGRSHPALGER